MSRRNRRGPDGPARPIRTKRDYEGASAIAKRLSSQKDLDSAAERRLQALLHELDEFDETQENDALDDLAGDESYSGPRRRWSDDGSAAG